MPNLTAKIPVISALIFAQITFSILGGIVFISPQNDGKIKDGVLVGNIDLGGLTYSQGYDKLRKTQPVDLVKNMELTFRGKTWPLPWRDIDANYDFEQTLRNAFSIGNAQGFYNKRLSNLILSQSQVAVPLAIKYDFKKLNNFLKKIAGEINVPSRNASIELVDNDFVITPETKGLKLVLEANETQIKNAIKEGRTDPIELVVEETLPDLTATELARIGDSLAVSVTVLNVKDKNRTQNIAKAAGALDGTVLKPREQFSFNSRTGPRLQDNGYVKAPVISNKRIVLELAGGVCQVSTTLYQAALNAGLKATERSPHSRPTSYVPLGQDAAVYAGQLDFKFRNTFAEPIYISAKLNGDKLIIRLFGKKKNEITYKVTSEDIRKYKPKLKIVKNSDLYQGTSKVVVEGVPGYSVKVYRSLYEDGKLLNKELISKDYYPPKDTVMMVGAKTFFSNGK